MTGLQPVYIDQSCGSEQDNAQPLCVIADQAYHGPSPTCDLVTDIDASQAEERTDYNDQCYVPFKICNEFCKMIHENLPYVRVLTLGSQRRGGRVSPCAATYLADNSMTRCCLVQWETDHGPNPGGLQPVHIDQSCGSEQDNAQPLCVIADEAHHGPSPTCDLVTDIDASQVEEHTDYNDRRYYELLKICKDFSKRIHRIFLLLVGLTLGSQRYGGIVAPRTATYSLLSMISSISWVNLLILTVLLAFPVQVAALARLEERP